MWDLMKQVCGAMGVRTNVNSPKNATSYSTGRPSKAYSLQAEERRRFRRTRLHHFNAVYTVENALAKAKDEKGLKRVVGSSRKAPCADCGGTRLSVAARAPHVRGLNGRSRRVILDAAADWVRGVPDPARRHAADGHQHLRIILDVARRLLDLGLGYRR